MRLNRQSIISGMQHIANKAPTIYGIPGEQWRQDALDAMAYIRQLEGELRRQGFTDYSTKEEEDND
jgi:hypothetical protein